MTTTIYPKVVVLATNAEGSPEFHSCSPEVTREQFDAGEHYTLAKENAKFNGYEDPMIAFDVTDSAAKQLARLAAWF